MVIEEDLTWGGECTIPYIDDMWTLETNIIILNNVITVNLIKTKRQVSIEALIFFFLLWDQKHFKMSLIHPKKKKKNAGEKTLPVSFRSQIFRKVTI